MSVFSRLSLAAFLINSALLPVHGMEPGPDFNREIRPILSQYCFKCHGMDDKTRKGRLRLDLREEALKQAKSDAHAIIPGNTEKSELLVRIFSHDEEDVMPPPATKMVLSAAQKKLLKDWIAAGAPYAPHWAFAKPTQAAPPTSKHAAITKNAIDSFVFARLEKEGLQPSPEADRHTLCRRVYLDLIGLPPSPEEVEAFIKDTAPDAYEKLVDKLLASPRYGERWGRRWLDLARYADTNGYEKDRKRTIWPYRDWVINALNQDMPFDQFSIKQLAGDMLPNATPDDIVATGFHRNTMLNEEGGIDPLEFRYHAVADRVSTTGITWLGLTVGCAQCHTHKFDPLLHKEYYQMMAFLDNADEPDYAIPDATREKKRAEIEARIAKLTAELPTKWRIQTGSVWTASDNVRAETTSGAKATKQPDNSIKLSGVLPDKDSYTVSFEIGEITADRLKLETLKDGASGPGRTPHGNFVLTDLSLEVAAKDAPEKFEPVKLVRAEADYSQSSFDIAGAIDGDPETGWAIDTGAKKKLQPQSATFYFANSITFPKGALWRVKMDQHYGGKHTIERFRLSLGSPAKPAAPNGELAKEQLEKRFAEWEKNESSRAVEWKILRPSEYKSNVELLTLQNDGSILASGDISKSDTYDLKFSEKIQGVTAIRLEVLPHESLPGGGPGMAYYEGPKGDFFLSELRISVGAERLKVSHATQSNEAGKNRADKTQDENMSSGWSTSDSLHQAHCAVFEFEKPIDLNGALVLKMQFERHYACPLGHFRISVTTSAKKTAAHKHSAEVEQALARAAAERTPADKELIFNAFLAAAPELADAREEINKLRNSLPAMQTTLVLKERPANNPRATMVRHRGEYTQPEDRVAPGVPAFLPSLPQGTPVNRLSFAKWLVSPENPLTARVTVNRQWQAFFGRGIVRTLEDFGYQGESPSHPELLDWLAVEFVKQNWSMKKLHKLIVSSATYKQSSRVSHELAQVDPNNILLARGPRFRIEAEVLRDSVLKSSGLLSEKMGGPGVFPPQPASVTSEGAYGPMSWMPSTGEDRWRRSVYTFIKRTTPFAMYSTFDAPTGEACLARREVSNSALQALTLLNDSMFVEAAQALGTLLVDKPGSDDERISKLYMRCLSRLPSADEKTALNYFLKNQRERLASKEINPVAILGKDAPNAADRALWTLTARAVLNLDEAFTKR